MVGLGPCLRTQASTTGPRRKQAGRLGGGLRGALSVVPPAALLLWACGREVSPSAPASAWTPAPAPDSGEVVARVGGVPIFASAIRGQAQRSGQSPARALEDLIAFELLAEKARAVGIAPGPHRQALPRELLVQRLLERELEATTRPEDIPDAELRQIYERMRSTFVHPRLVEIVVLSVYTGPLMKPEPRARAARAARELADFVSRRTSWTADELFALAQEERWRARNVAVTRVLQGPDRPFGPKVGAGALLLGGAGQLTPPIEDETGHHIALYVGERPPKDVPFEQAREEIRREVHSLWRKRRFLEETGKLAATHVVEVYPDRLSPMATSEPSPGVISR